MKPVWDDSQRDYREPEAAVQPEIEYDKLNGLWKRLREIAEEYKQADDGGLFDLRRQIVRNAMVITEIAMSAYTMDRED